MLLLKFLVFKCTDLLILDCHTDPVLVVGFIATQIKNYDRLNIQYYYLKEEKL